jgi:phosphoglycolate phosphatase-like HAD superfamily hydrolase
LRGTVIHRLTDLVKQFDNHIARQQLTFRITEKIFFKFEKLQQGKMKLCDLIKSNNWLSVELTLLKLYPDQDRMLDEYRNVYEKLKVTEPADYDELEIILKEYDCDPNFESGKETYVDVSGQKKNTRPKRHYKRLRYRIFRVGQMDWYGHSNRDD